MSRLPAESCPCGRPLTYSDCCGRFHTGTPAPDAESLMRSRYVAYVRGLEDYLRATWHPTTRPVALHLNDPPLPKWLGLEVRAHHAAEHASGSTATVEFVARCRVGGRGQRLHEISRFVCEDGCWYYVDGDVG
jgi:SEC-C motif-containing protein